MGKWTYEQENSIIQAHYKRMAECDHTDDNGLCRCNSGAKFCSYCQTCFDDKHAQQHVTAEKCGHAHLSTIARVIELGVPCPLCGEQE